MRVFNVSFVSLFLKSNKNFFLVFANILRNNYVK